MAQVINDKVYAPNRVVIRVNKPENGVTPAALS